MTHRSRPLPRLPRRPATRGSITLGLLLLTALGRPAGPVAAGSDPELERLVDEELARE